MDPASSQDQLAFDGDRGFYQAAAVATVEQLTGVRIDHFAVVNLYGFYELARVLGGVEVCLNRLVQRSRPSGRPLPGLGYQHLDASQALAFVRQRDGLPNGDLDRTHRQQAFLDSVMHQLRSEGVMDDLTKVSALLKVARQYVITDSGWNLLDFAAQARNLTTANLVFHTLPIKGFATIDGQDANSVNPAYIRQIVQNTFNPAAAAPVARTSRRAGPSHPARPAVSPSGPAAVTPPTTGPQGGAVAARNGIPCVN